MNKDRRLTVSAGAIGANFVNDPELNLPRYPRYITEIQMLPFGQSGIIFVGGSGYQVISGSSARSFLPRLIKHLTGHNSLEDLGEIFPQLSAKVLTDSVTLLFSRGLLEDGIAAEDEIETTPLLAFSGRYIDVTRINKNRSQVKSRLSSSRVGIAVTTSGGIEYANELQSSLQNLGLKTLELLTSPDQINANFDLLITAFQGQDESAAKWMSTANRHKVSVLHSSFNGQKAEIGPLFVPVHSGCYDCFRQLHVAGPETKAHSDWRFWLGVVSLHAFNLLSRVGNFDLYNVCRTHHVIDGDNDYSQQRVVRLPGCKTCGLEHVKSLPDLPSMKPWLLHNSAVIVSSYALRNPKEHQSHYAATNIDISSERPKPLVGAPIVQLPDGENLQELPSWKQQPGEREEVNLNQLAVLLRYSVGYQTVGSDLRRIAPSGGGLGSAELFLIVRDVDGLDNGIYHYFAIDHVLERLGDVPDELLCGVLGVTRTSLPQLVLVGVANMAKLREKYDKFSYRLSIIDSGVAQGYLHEISSAMSLRFVEYTDARDSALASLIMLPTRGNKNQVTFAIGFGLSRDAKRNLELGSHHNFYVDELIESVSMLGNPVQMPRGKMPLAADPLRDIKVPTLQQIMLSRRSIRHFSNNAIPFAVLSAMVQLSTELHQLKSVAHGGLSVDLTLWVAVNQGDDEYQPGIYKVEGGKLVLQREGLNAVELEPLMLQRSFANAPVVIFVTGNIETTLVNHNARGYRALIQSAGYLMSNLFLAAQSYQVSGCIWGGIYEETWGDLFAIDRLTNCPIVACSLGYPVYA